MNINQYKFTISPFGWEGDYGIEYDSLPENEKALVNISWHGWTAEKIQTIIDKSLALSEEEEYEYVVEGSDLFMLVTLTEAHFFDWRTEQKDADIIWPLEKFISFMEDFKAFVKENS